MKQQKPVIYQCIQTGGPSRTAQFLAEDSDGKQVTLNYELLELNMAIASTQKRAEEASCDEDKAFWSGENATYEKALTALRAAKFV